MGHGTLSFSENTPWFGQIAVPPGVTYAGRGKKRLGFHLNAVFNIALLRPSNIPVVPFEEMRTETSVTDRHWVDLWTTAHSLNRPQWLFPDESSFPSAPAQMFLNSTIRQTFRVNQRAQTIRVTITNEFGDSPLLLSGAAVAIPLKYKDHVPGSPNIVSGGTVRLSFTSSKAINIPRGGTVLSDPIQFPLQAFDDISISLYLAEGHDGMALAGHEGTKSVSWVAPGDRLSSLSLETSHVSGHSRPVKFWFYVSSIQGLVPTYQRSLICFGDSITDQGAGDNVIPMNTYNGWTDRLAHRLQQSNILTLRDIALVNMGVSGHQIYSDGLKRFERDVVSRPGVAYVLVHMGVNDINGYPATVEDQETCFERVVFAFSQIIDRSHEANISVFGSTIVPFLAPPDYVQPPGVPPRHYSDPLREGVRHRINKWIRENAKFDYVVDFDAVTRDPEHPARLRVEYGGQDFLHPSVAGLNAMGDAVDLGIFQRLRGGMNS